jgi:hypothetical protein
MTEAQYKEAHIALWDWLFHHPSMGKKDWPGWKEKGGQYEDIENYCFACQSCSGNDAPYWVNCGSCPLEITPCGDDESPFEYWFWSYSPRIRKKYALIIRDSWREVPK